MAKRRIVNYYPSRDCFRRKYRGQTYYLATGGRNKGETPQQHEERAIAEWLVLKPRLDNEACSSISQQQPKTQTVAVGTGVANGDMWDDPNPTPVSMLQGWESGKQSTAELLKHSARASIVSHLPREIPTVARQDRPTYLREVIDAYLARRRNDAEAQRISNSTYLGDKHGLDDFLGFCEHVQRTDVHSIDAQTLRFYQEHTLSLPPYVKRLRRGKRIEEITEPITPRTAQKRLKTVRVFMEWAYRHEYIDMLPRNIDRHYAKVKLPDPKPTIFSRDEVRELFRAAAKRNKYSRTKARRPALYVALGLNCGYGPGTIANLRHEEIEWDNPNGVVIRRKRDKTGSPQVHKLWGLTIELLKEEMTDATHHELVLLSHDGLPLVVETLDKKIAKNNVVGRSVERVRRKLIKQGLSHWEGPNRGIAILRKTGADWLKEKFPAMPQVYKQYLGHKFTGQDPSRIDRHYVNEHYGPLFDCLTEMETHFDLASLL